jgi:hypothetical protein
MANDAESVVTEETASRFEKPFEGINARFEQIEARGGTKLMPKTK